MVSKCKMDKLISDKKVFNGLKKSGDHCPADSFKRVV